MGKTKGRSSACATVTTRRYSTVTSHMPSARYNTRTIIWAGALSFIALTMLAMPQHVIAQPIQQSAPTPLTAGANSAAKPAKTPPPVAWKKIPDNEKKVLAPLEKNWGNMPSAQQRKLVTAAKEYPKLSPIEQERFQRRLKGWSTLTPEQRNLAREKYQSLRKLPPDKQHELKARWQEKSIAEQSAASPATTSK